MSKYKILPFQSVEDEMYWMGYLSPEVTEERNQWVEYVSTYVAYR